jgi:hypothetical protein
MSGRVVRAATFEVSAGKEKVTVPLDAAGYATLAKDGSALISFETPSDAVQAFFIPLTEAT